MRQYLFQMKYIKYTKKFNAEHALAVPKSKYVLPWTYNILQRGQAWRVRNRSAISQSPQSAQRDFHAPLNGITNKNLVLSGHLSMTTVMELRWRNRSTPDFFIFSIFSSFSFYTRVKDILKKRVFIAKAFFCNIDLKTNASWKIYHKLTILNEDRWRGRGKGTYMYFNIKIKCMNVTYW